MRKLPNPAKRAAEFFARAKPIKPRERRDRIPLSAWLGASVFAFVLWLMMHVGALAGY